MRRRAVAVMVLAACHSTTGCVIEQLWCEPALEVALIDDPPAKDVRYGLALIAWTEYQPMDHNDDPEMTCEVLELSWIDRAGTHELAGAGECNASTTFALSVFRDDDGDGTFDEGNTSEPSEAYCTLDLGASISWDGPHEVRLQTSDQPVSAACEGLPVRRPEESW